MASIYRRNKIYWGCIYSGGKRVWQGSLKTGSKREALLRLRNKERQLLFGIGNEKATVSIAKALREYYIDIETERRPMTLRALKGRLNILFKHWQEQNIVNLSDITPAAMSEFKNYLLSLGRSPLTYNHYLECLKAFLNWVVRNRPEYLADNPIKHMTRIKQAYIRSVRYFKKSELEKIYAHLPENRLPFIKILVNTGMRLAELIHLKWENVNLRNKTLVIEADPADNWYPKTYESRTIPLNKNALEVFKGLKRGKGYVFEKRPPEYWSRPFHKAVIRAGVGGRLHDLRHTFGVHHVLAGTNIFILMKLMGHASITTTQIYAQVCSEDLKDYVDNINL